MESLRDIVRQAAEKAAQDWHAAFDPDDTLDERIADAVAVTTLKHALSGFNGFWPNDVRYSIESMLAEFAVRSGGP